MSISPSSPSFPLQIYLSSANELACIPMFYTVIPSEGLLNMCCPSTSYSKSALARALNSKDITLKNSWQSAYSHWLSPSLFLLLPSYIHNFCVFPFLTKTGFQLMFALGWCTLHSVQQGRVTDLTSFLKLSKYNCAGHTKRTVLVPPCLCSPTSV